MKNSFGSMSLNCARSVGGFAHSALSTRAFFKMHQIAATMNVKK